MDHGQVVDATFLVAGGDAPGLLEAVEQTFDFVALAVGVTVEAGLAPLILPARDNWADVATAQPSTCCRAAVALVPGQPTWSQTRAAATLTADCPLVQHRFQSDLLMPLATGQHNRDRPSVAFRTQMHLG